MCLAIPGRIIDKNGQQLTVAYDGGLERKAHAGGLEVSVGDIVMVQMGSVVRTLSESEYESVMSAWRETQQSLTS